LREKEKKDMERKKQVKFDPISVVFYYKRQEEEEKHEFNQIDHVINMLEVLKIKILNELDKCPPKRDDATMCNKL
jgi:hypothetical protein